MNIQQAQKEYLLGTITKIEIMRSPTNNQFWFITVRNKKMKPLLLVNKTDEVQTYFSLEEAISAVKDIGFKTALVLV